MSVTAVRGMGALGAHRRSCERPERTLYDVSARPRFGRYEMKSERRTAQIFVAVLGASSFTYAQATWTLRGDRRRAGAAGMRQRMPRPWYPMKWRPQFSPELGPFDGLTRAVSEPVASP
jgi:hypothetical protein